MAGQAGAGLAQARSSASAMAALYPPAPAPLSPLQLAASSAFFRPAAAAGGAGGGALLGRPGGAFMPGVREDQPMLAPPVSGWAQLRRTSREVRPPPDSLK